MYKIDSMYEAMADALVEAIGEGKTSRWMAASAWWLGRQQIANAPDYWFAVAARITADLPEAERAGIVAQLSKAEDHYVDTAAAMPGTPDNVASWFARWEPADAPIDIDKLRAEAAIKVDRGAEAYRLNFITAGAGQVMAYQQKLSEAEAFLADANIDEDTIPHIVAEAAMDGVSLADKATEIVSVFHAWQAVSAGIEAKRLGAKKAIGIATTKSEIDTAAAVNWQGQ
ncbi:hypothetical protein P6U16_08355 [Rhizobium sp. 32-5/1]|uniref:hypothetical protein n=1 Tax=Rhizobium sp. 32-5/1 TaxID=3019602 RepID=UPI00240D68FB|nr:hypothetical protein [Rhizobium sp. 32-5/1]WEZ84571.1 hypothetical protein P6U16_08355 [Rhizobium sp. 32-5/1]